ncbi:MAG: hypothetical protein Q9168_007635 [Polycauliona sp. 1 TL-2023]
MEVPDYSPNDSMKNKKRRRSRKKRANTLNAPSEASTPSAKTEQDMQALTVQHHDQQDDNDTLDRVLRLPQELIDMIKEELLEVLFCPGYYLPQVHDQATYTWRLQTHDIARPELLRLNKEIYNRYQLRMWMENTCVVKMKSGLYFELVPVYGHLRDANDPWRYVFEQSKASYPGLINDMDLTKPRPFKTKLRQGDSKDLDDATGWSIKYSVRGLLNGLPKIRNDQGLILEYLQLADRYDSLGTWLGVGLPEHFHGPGWFGRTESPRSVEVSQDILLKAITILTKRTAACHAQRLPEMANRFQERRVCIILVGIHIFLFL